MALKDWKKIEKDRWRKQSDNFLVELEIIYAENYKREKKYRVKESMQKLKKNQYGDILVIRSGSIFIGSFDTKSEALKKVKQYMRKH